MAPSGLLERADGAIGTLLAQRLADPLKFPALG
jgi:hypothetical protein